MRKPLIAVLLILCLLTPFGALAETEGEQPENLLYNGDFSVYTESASLPSGWDFEAYDQEGAEAWSYFDEDIERVVVAVGNTSLDDARACQTVTVEPDSVYCLSAMVRTVEVEGGTGATLSIDNYSVDGTYCYSENLHGTNDWTEQTMYVRTGKQQTGLRVALRVGGYGTTASGTAYFAGVSLVKTENPEDVVIDLMTENGSVSGVSAESAASPVSESAAAMFALMIAAALLTAAGYLLLYRRVLRYERPLPALEENQYALPIVLVAAFICRLVLSLVFYGHPTDINCFMAWGNAMLTEGPAHFYTSGMFADYPPAYMYICGGLSWLCRVLGIPYGSTGMAYLFKLPATIADLASAYFVYRIALKNRMSKSFGLVLAAVVALNPVLMFLSGGWGQIDTVLTLLLILTCWCFQEDKWILAGAVYGFAILMKPQALMLGPLIAVAYIAGVMGPDWKKRLLKTLLAVLAALGVLFLVSLPCQDGQPWYWLVDKYASTANSYPYMSIESFNLASLLGGNWKPVDTLILGVPFRIWGTLGIALSVAFSIGLFIKGRERNRGALYLAGALMIVLIFTLGHYMHERYMIPALLLLIMAYLYYRDRRILIAFGAVSVTALLNVTAAMYVVDHQAARGVFYNVYTAAGSVLELLSCGYLTYVSFRILWQGQLLPSLVPPAETARETRAVPASSGKQPVLPPLPVDNGLHYSRRDILSLLCLVLVYGVVALTNLGTTSFPETHWESAGAGETITVDFGKPVHLEAYWVNGNLGTGGTLLLRGNNGREETFEQIYDEMFRWTTRTVDMTAERLTLTVYSGSLNLNEIAFFDQDGNLLSVHAVDATAEQEKLFDEQDTVPNLPSYYNGMYFDELYHGRTAYEHLHNLIPYENSHPPLGKLFIMLGVAVFGMCPFGWRIAGALFGIAMLPVFYAFSKRIFKDSSFALVATGLFAFDFMHFTQTRIATIDVYAVFFILCMYYYMYQYVTMNFFVDGLKRTFKPLALAGVFFGVGAACKWTCIYAGMGLAVLLLCSLIARYLEYDRIMKTGTVSEQKQVACFWPNVWKTVGFCCIFYILVPVTIYFFSYTPYFIYQAGEQADYGFAGMVKTFAHYQEFMYTYHSTLNATHPYQSPWYSWPFTVKPIWYYFCSEAKGAYVSTISASGNPAVWWICSVSAVVLLLERILGRVKADRALQVICVGILANFLPWVLVTRCTFIYHFFATVPFLILAGVYLLQSSEKRDPAGIRWVKWAWLTLAVVFFILLYPGLSGLPVSHAWADIIKVIPGGKLMYGA